MSDEIGVILRHRQEFIVYLEISSIKPLFWIQSHPFHWKFLGLVLSTLVAGAGPRV